MTLRKTLKHEFVEFIPDVVNEDTLYVSIEYATVVHKCCCGCGSEVVTPLSPTDWELIFNGRTISLAPSIGNWGLPCKSHYWIKNNRVKWARRWSQEEVNVGKAHDSSAKKKYFNSDKTLVAQEAITNVREVEGKVRKTLWRKLKKYLQSLGFTGRS